VRNQERSVSLPASHSPGTRASPARRPHLTPAELLELSNAFLFAEMRGVPLNTFVTVTFKLSRHSRWKPQPGDVEGDRERRSIKDLLRALNGFSKRYGLRNAWVYVLENPPKGGPGPHVHLLLHLPQASYQGERSRLEMLLGKHTKWTPAEIEATKLAFAGKSGALAGHEEVILPFHIANHSEPEIDEGTVDPLAPLNPKERITRLRYMAKGVDPNLIVSIGGQRKTIENHAGGNRNQAITIKNQGDPRIAKRVGSSRSLGKTARDKDTSWTERLDFDWLSRDVARKQVRAHVQEQLRRLWEGR